MSWCRAGCVIGEPENEPKIGFPAIEKIFINENRKLVGFMQVQCILLHVLRHNLKWQQNRACVQPANRAVII